MCLFVFLEIFVFILHNYVHHTDSDKIDYCLYIRMSTPRKTIYHLETCCFSSPTCTYSECAQGEIFYLCHWFFYTYVYFDNVVVKD